MDSPIFGNHNNRSRQNNKSNGHSVQFVTNRVYDRESPLQWQFSKKSNQITNTQMGNQLKLAYAMLIMENNFQTLLFKLTKCMNKKKHQAFKQINKNSKLQPPLLTQRQYSLHSTKQQQVNNPQTLTATLAQICMKETQQRLVNMMQIISRVQMRKLARGWRRITIQSQCNRYSPSSDNSNSMNTGSTILQQSTTIGISSSKLQSKKQLNSKKHAKQMKQNSLVNNGKNPQFQNQNQRMEKELLVDEISLDKFTTKMNTLLAYHEGLLAGETTDRLSDGKDYHQRSMYSYENSNNYQHNTKPIQGTKSQVYTKKK